VFKLYFLPVFSTSTLKESWQQKVVTR